MSLYVVDVESDGPIPGKYSMVSLGAVLVEPGLGRTFFGRTRPISDAFLPEALAISGTTRQEHLRTTPHDHDPVNDAKGNAEALLAMVDMGLKLPVR